MRSFIIATISATLFMLVACDSTTHQTNETGKENANSKNPLEAKGIRERIVENHFKFIPSGKGPFPTIIAIPGCSGIALPNPEAEAKHPILNEDDRLFRRHYLRMAERFRNESFAVLLIHIHRAEGLVKACGGEIESERIAEYINESVAWAKGLNLVDKTRIHVVGWSMGGGGTLAWFGDNRSESGFVRSVVSVYPGCSDLKPLTNQIPLLLLLGGSDDIADPSVCENLVAASKSKPMVTVRRYPGARHGYDISDAPPVMDIGNGMSIGYQKKAAEESWREILVFLSKH
jgi:dienelactone hydrolase